MVYECAQEVGYKERLQARLSALRDEARELTNSQTLAVRQVRYMSMANALCKRRGAERDMRAANSNSEWRERKVHKYQQQTVLGKLVHKNSYLQVTSASVSQVLSFKIKQTIFFDTFIQIFFVKIMK